MSQQNTGSAPPLTTASGMPVGDNRDFSTAGPPGPVLMAHCQLLEKLSHQNRERLPERSAVDHWRSRGRH